jgi:hypothetical protein
MLWFKRKKDDIRIINDFKEHITNEEFRLKTDKPHVIRVIQDRPGVGIYSYLENLSYELARSVRVAGLSYRKEAVAKFIEGKNKRVELEYESTEKYPQAIKVIGIWEDENSTNKEQIGYVEDEVAQRIYEEFDKIPIGATLWTIYKPYEDRDTGIRICIWAPSPGKQKKYKKK